MSGNHLQLPVELYQPIVSHLPSPKYRTDHLALATCSKALYAAVIRELYHTIELRDRLTTDLFLQRVTADGGIPEIATFVRGLILVLEMSDREEVVQRVLGTLSIFHNLKSFEIRGIGAEERKTQPIYLTSGALEEPRFKLDHLRLNLSFVLDNAIVNFLNWHHNTLTVLEVWYPISPEPDSDDEEEFISPQLPVLEALAAPGIYLAWFMENDRCKPTKICDIDDSMRHRAPGLHERTQTLTSWTTRDCLGPIDWMPPSAFASLQLVRLLVKYGREVMYLFLVHLA